MENKDKIKLAPLYYFYGEEDFLIDEEVQKIKSAALTGGFASMNYQGFSVKEADPAEVVASAMTMPAFAPVRVIVVKDAAGLKKDALETYSSYAMDPSPSTALIFTADTWKVSKGNKLFDAVKKKGVVRACKRLDEDALLTWVREEAGRQGSKITRGAAERLVSLAGGGLRDLKGELDKVILYLGDGGDGGEAPTVDEAAALAAASDVRDETAFDLTDAIGRRDAGRAVKILQKIAGEEPLKVLGAIVWQFRILMKIKGLEGRGEPKSKVKSQCGAPYMFFEKYYQGSRRFSVAALKRAFKAFATADRELKSSGLPGDLVMWRLVMELCGGR